MTKTPRTEAVAQSVSTDSEHSDLTAYTIMYAHARTLEAENERLLIALRKNCSWCKGDTQKCFPSGCPFNY